MRHGPHVGPIAGLRSHCVSSGPFGLPHLDIPIAVDRERVISQMLHITSQQIATIRHDERSIPT